MIIAEKIECVIESVKDLTAATASCTTSVSNGPSSWDIASTVTNWGLLIVAAGALWVSFRSLSHARTNAENVRDDNYKATQAQLEASREASRVDLEERRNSRELDITASLVTALDELQLAIAVHPDDPDRTTTITRAASRVISRFSRFDLFVKESPTLRALLTWLVEAQTTFEPEDVEDFESEEFMRIARVQSVLRLGVVRFQATRELPIEIRIVEGALSTGDFKIADSFLFMHDPGD